jgi:hypothetical protein
MFFIAQNSILFENQAFSIFKIHKRNTKHSNLDPKSKYWIRTGKKKTLIATKLKSVVERQRLVRQFEAKVVE